MPVSCVERRLYLATGTYDWSRQTVELHGEWEPSVPGNRRWGSLLDPRF